MASFIFQSTFRLCRLSWIRILFAERRSLQKCEKKNLFFSLIFRSYISALRFGCYGRPARDGESWNGLRQLHGDATEVVQRDDVQSGHAPVRDGLPADAEPDVQP